MKQHKQPELIHAYTIILSLAMLLHLIFAGIFSIMQHSGMVGYNLFSSLFYLILLILIRHEYYRLTVTLTHLEVCLFVLISTLLFGFSSWFFIYLIAMASLVYFNPFRRSFLIYIFPAVETGLFLVLWPLLQHHAPVFPLDDVWSIRFFFINAIGCFGIIITGTIVSEVSSHSLKLVHARIAYDRLTGLYNKEYFQEKAARILQETPHEEYYLVLTNIVGFKYFNELFGKAKGDEMLQAQADVLRRHRQHLTVYGRVSGNEFAFLIRQSTFQEDAFRQIITRLQARYTSNLYLLRILCGIYRIDRSNHGESVESMLDKAKMTIDSIKSEYNTCFAFYDRYILDKSLQEKQLLGEFEHALENGQFCFYLQPQITREHTCPGAEALVRWHHPEKGLISPGEFLPVLEDTGLIWKLDCYIWEQVVRKLKEWESRGRQDTYISVNISPRDFYYLDIYKIMTQLVEKYQIRPSQLKLEITETALMMDIQKQIPLIRRLKDYGFEIEIDDFGSGYSSLNTLKDIHANTLKIDMGFLQETQDNARNWSILTSIMNLAGSIGMNTITEGVETPEQFSRLIQIGCQMFQGYYFSKPVTVRDFEKRYL